MKVDITRDHDRGGWCYTYGALKSRIFPTYPDTVQHARATGYEIDNAGWRHRMLMWNFNNHAMDGYPGWEIETERAPAFAKLTHIRGKVKAESYTIACEWDDIATVDFYQRDWTDDGIPFVHNGETYWSGWWFATIAERDRFVEWKRGRS